MPLSPLKLPRLVELSPLREAVEAALAKDVRPVWEKSTLLISQIPLLPGLEAVLALALQYRQLSTGLEQIEKILNNEKKGIAALQEKQGTPPANRISRLLIIANDGAERFNRSCESILMKHGDRVRLLRVDAPSSRLVEKLYGADRAIKALLVTDRDAVSHVLLSLVEPKAR